MATITNKTNSALAIPLPGGKKLRLGPFKSGEISAKAVDHPPVQKLIEGGDVVCDGAGQKSRHEPGVGKGSRRSSAGTGQGGNIRRTGDR